MLGRQMSMGIYQYDSYSTILFGRGRKKIGITYSTIRFGRKGSQTKK